MAQLDKFIAALFSKKAETLLLHAGQLPVLALNGRQLPLMDKRPTGGQVRKLVLEISPEGLQQALEHSDRASFEYRAPSGGVSIAVTAWNGETLAEIKPASSLRMATGGTVLELDLSSQRPLASAVSPPALELEVPRATTGVESSEARQSASSLLGSLPAARLEQATRSAPAIDRLFHRLVEANASDLHLASQEAPMIRKDGDMVRLEGEPRMDAESLFRLLEPIMPESNRSEFAKDNDTDFAYAIDGLARFRGNMFRDRLGVGAVFRTIPAEIISAEKLGLSEAITGLCGLHKGLVLVTGPTGSGKSTTLCALIDLINRTRHGHIITIEDPIEFVHENKRCLVNQREVGAHTNSFKRALRAALREDPDVILVGEMRDLETIAIAIETAETGHLVFGTLHTTTAYSTIDRIVDQFPPDQQEQIRVMLSESLKGVVSQTLCKKIGGGRAAALEFLLVTPAVSNLIREGKTFQIPSIMQTSRNLGMRLLNESLLELVEGQKVTAAEALAKAVDKTGLKQQLTNKNLLG